MYLKSGSHFPKKIGFISFNESHLKMIKDAFYFIFNALFVFKIFKFVSWLFGYVEKNGVIRKIRLISKFMGSQPSSQAFTIHVKATRQCNLVSQLNITRDKSHAENEEGRVVPHLFLFIKKASWEVKASSRSQHVSWNIF